MKNFRLGFLIFVLFIPQLKAQTVRIACQHDYYPYSWIDSLGKQQGLLIDYWNLWAEKTGATLEFIPGPTHQCISRVLSDSADVVAGMLYHDSYIGTLEFSDFIMRLNTTLFLRNRYKPKSVYDISFPIDIIQDEQAFEIFTEKFPGLELELHEDFRSIANEVLMKETKAFVYDYPVPNIEFQYVRKPKGYYNYHVLSASRLTPAIKAGNLEMLSLIQQGNIQITDEELLSIASKYAFFQGNKPISKEVIAGATTLLLITLAYFLLLRKYRRKLKRKKLIANDDLQAIIEKGENDEIEFKSSMRWDLHQEKPNKALELVIVKTISALLNSQGGILFIGVQDNGKIIGIENDYQTFSKRNSDGFLLAITNLINQNLGKNMHQFISINIIAINGKDICIVHVEPAPAPVFLGSKDKEEFYIRASASSQPLSISETMEYIKQHWKD